MGADYDQRAIEQARQLYNLPNLAYKVGDVTYWEETLGRDKFDCIVSFDTLEHVSHREIMLQNVVYHLQEDGCMLLSTPCTETINLNPTWEHHHIEYSFASLHDFLRRYFLNIQRPDNLSLPHTEVFDRLEGSSVSYQLQLNPVICQQPIVIANPYQGASMHLQTGGHLATRGLAIWRVFGVRTLIRRAWGYLRRKFLPD